MPERSRKSAPTILIVDDEPGFLIWLGQTLAANGYLSIPATTGSQATKVIREFQLSIDLAVVNFALPSTADLIKTLKSKDPFMKVIAIRGSPPGTIPTTKVDAIHPRSHTGWPAKVRRVLAGEVRGAR